tara:strand:+ start:341 stop:589 length:249 start_codon:yes stop_codon:yes gene_type:complete
MNDEERQEAINRINERYGHREALEAIHGQVWDTQELQDDFSVRSFLAPFVLVDRKSDGEKGTLIFQHHPRFYYDFTSEGETK